MSGKRDKVIAELREHLLERRDAIRKALAGDLSALQALNETGDSVDFASDSTTTELNSQLAEVESRELQLIDNALLRMEEGTYGLCEITGREIPLARLEALPYATICIEAQREIEKRGRKGHYTPDWSRMIDAGGDDAISLNDIELA